MAKLCNLVIKRNLDERKGRRAHGARVRSQVYTVYTRLLNGFRTFFYKVKSASNSQDYEPLLINLRGNRL